MSDDKKDLRLDEKLAEDLLIGTDETDFLESMEDEIDGLDSIEGLGDIEDLDELDNLGYDEVPDEIDDHKDNNSTKDEVTLKPSKNESEIVMLDSEISKLKDELEELESDSDDLEEYDDSFNDEPEEDDDINEEESNEDESDEDATEDTSALSLDELEKLEEKRQKKNTLIMRGAMGVFALMVGGFGYNLMFSGGDDAEGNEFVQTEIPKEEKLTTISQDTLTPNLDDVFSVVENKDAVELESSVNKNNLDENSGDIDLLADQLLNETLESTVNKNTDTIETKENITEVPTKESIRQTEVAKKVNINEELYNQVTKGLSRAQGLNVIRADNQKPYILGQDDVTRFNIDIGNEIQYYAYNIKIISVLLNGDLILLSNGTYVDLDRSPLDKEMLKLLEMQESIKLKEQSMAREKEISEQNRLVNLAAEKAREEERIKATEAKAKQDAELAKALARLNALADEVEQQKIEASKPKKVVPKLLEGWSVNGEFKSVKNGYVLNGYLIRDPDGNFFRMLVGDTHSEFGLIRGYDGNGRFFIGDFYIL